MAVVVGALITLGAAELWMRHWASTGIRIPLDNWYKIDLPAGPTLVYYESHHSIPTGGVVIKEGVPQAGYVPRSLEEGLARGRSAPASSRDRFPLVKVAEDISFRLRMSEHAGRALWEIDLPKADSFEIRAINTNYPSDSDIPSDDRIVFCKEPDSVKEAVMNQRVIHGAGAGVTVGLAIFFYVLHGRAAKA